MAEKELTKKITTLIKGADKLVQDIERDIRQIRDSFTSLRDLLKKPEDKPKD